MRRKHLRVFDLGFGCGLFTGLPSNGSSAHKTMSPTPSMSSVIIASWLHLSRGNTCSLTWHFIGDSHLATVLYYATTVCRSSDTQ